MIFIRRDHLQLHDGTDPVEEDPVDLVLYLFRVRNKKETLYCYTEEERLAALEKIKVNPEITRFKGLGEISPEEFRHFIGPDIRLDQVTLRKEDSVKELLEFYMGKNTMERQNFIIQNLVVENDEEIAR